MGASNEEGSKRWFCKVMKFWFNWRPHMDMPPTTFLRGDKLSLKLHHLAHFKYQGKQLLHSILNLCKKAFLLCHLNFIFHYLPLGLHPLTSQIAPQKQKLKFWTVLKIGFSILKKFKITNIRKTTLSIWRDQFGLSCFVCQDYWLFDK